MTSSPVSDLREYVTEFKARCKVAGWFGALFHTEVVASLTKDIEQNQVAISDQAYSAEQSDLEAEKILDAVLADGVVTKEEVAKLKTAKRFIHRSAESDHSISSLARVAS